MRWLTAADIHIIPDAEDYRNYPAGNRSIPIRPAFPAARELLLTAGILVTATIVGWFFLQLGFANANIIMVYLLGVLLTSAFTSGYTCGVLSAFLSVILFNYFLTEPRLSLAAYGSKYPNNLCRHVRSSTFDQYACRKAQSPCAAICAGRLSGEAPF